MARVSADDQILQLEQQVRALRLADVPRRYLSPEMRGPEPSACRGARYVALAAARTYHVLVAPFVHVTSSANRTELRACVSAET